MELTAFAEAAVAGPGKQITLVLDGAGWHSSPHVQVPAHAHLRLLPADAPLVHRHFRDIQELEDAQMERCATLQTQPERMRSATLFSWWPRRVRKHQDGTSISQLLTDSQLRDQLGGNGRRKVEQHYSWSRIADDLESIYLRTLAATDVSQGLAGEQRATEDR